MTNLKKIGLTALAGTLATVLSAQAGEMTVSGTAKMSYNSNTDTTDGATNSSSEVMDTNTSIVFSGSGELDNGFGVSVSSNITGGANTVGHMTLDMGDMGTLSMDYNGDKHGLPAYSDKVPNAGEQVWDHNTAAHGQPAQGIVNPRADEGGTDDALGYSVSMSGVTLSTHFMVANADGSEASAVLVADSLVDGLAIGAGMGNNRGSVASTNDDLETYFITYTAGAVTVGAQNSKKDADTEYDIAGNATTNNTDVERDSYGISFAVNENLSISYGVSKTEFASTSITSDEENKGISASYTAGGMTVGLVHNQKDSAIGVSGTDQENTEISLAFAF